MAPAGKVDVVPEHPHVDGRAVDVRLRLSGGDAVAEVHNAGAPIPASALPDLFDPFTRGPSGGPRSGDSLGLGLFISREIVRAHGGSLGVRSSATEGTTFAVRLPREPPR
jgi:sigma-B regulation protein RsbU (phosphoserine phosphatase)